MGRIRAVPHGLPTTPPDLAWGRRPPAFGSPTAKTPGYIRPTMPMSRGQISSRCKTYGRRAERAAVLRARRLQGITPVGEGEDVVPPATAVWVPGLRMGWQFDLCRAMRAADHIHLCRHPPVIRLTEPEIGPGSMGTFKPIPHANILGYRNLLPAVGAPDRSHIRPSYPRSKTRVIFPRSNPRKTCPSMTITGVPRTPSVCAKSSSMYCGWATMSFSSNAMPLSSRNVMAARQLAHPGAW
jgi:hypothetical protein